MNFILKFHGLINRILKRWSVVCGIVEGGNDTNVSLFYGKTKFDGRESHVSGLSEKFEFLKLKDYYGVDSCERRILDIKKTEKSIEKSINSQNDNC